MAKDMICGMNVEEKGAKYKSDYKGKVYCFCSGMCKEEFDRNPEKYLG
jgi:YHS domain-containing protein